MRDPLAYTAAQTEAQAKMFQNRLKKRSRQLAPRFARAGIEAYRLYDGDIPELRAVVDRYKDQLVLGVYTRRQTEGAWAERMRRAAAEALSLPLSAVHLKLRRTRPQDGAPRYERLDSQGARFAVREGALSFWVNLTDFIDTGLFADHRLLRRRVGEEAEGCQLLNLFGYTGSFSCYAAAGGARGTTTVDLSGRYLDWAQDNLQLNGLAGRAHKLVQEDALSFVAQAGRRGGPRYELILLDPPSFSTVGGAGGWDVLEDHPALIEACLRLLTPEGRLYFSTNHQRFELGRLRGAAVEEITEATTPPDFRSPHRSFLIQRA